MAHLNDDLHQDPELANIIAQSIKEYDEQQLRNIHDPEYYKHLSDDDLELKRVLEQTQNLDTDLTSAISESLLSATSITSSSDIAFDMAIQESNKIHETQLTFFQHKHVSSIGTACLSILDNFTAPTTLLDLTTPFENQPKEIQDKMVQYFTLKYSQIEGDSHKIQALMDDINIFGRSHPDYDFGIY